MKMFIKCNYCRVGFEKSLSSINQNKKRGYKNYCSRNCRAKGRAGIILRLIKCTYCREKFKRALWRINQNKRCGIKNYCSKKCKCKALSKWAPGENHPHWKGGITPGEIKERQSHKNKQFIKYILRQDDYTCQICSNRGIGLVVDHVMPWSLYRELRHDPENCRTLCRSCHKKYGANPLCRPIKWAISPIVRI